MSFGYFQARPMRMVVGHRNEPRRDSCCSKPEFHLAAEVAWGLLPQVDGTTDETEDADEFCDHLGKHPKTAGRTFTGSKGSGINY